MENIITYFFIENLLNFTKKTFVLVVKLYGAYLVLHCMQEYIEKLEMMSLNIELFDTEHLSEMYFFGIENFNIGNKRNYLVSILKKFPIINLIIYTVILIVFNDFASLGFFHGFGNVVFEGLYISFEHDPIHFLKKIGGFFKK